MHAGVVGCGPGGLAAAIALARKGWSVTLFERAPEPGPVGAGLLLQPTGLAALAHLGAAEAVLGAGAPIRRVDGRSAAGATVLAMAYPEGQFGLGVHRGALFSALFDRAQAERVSIRAGVEIVRAEPASGGGPSGDGPSRDGGRPVLIDAEGARHGPFDLAIAADGSGSALRRQIKLRARAPLNVWGAVWCCTALPDDWPYPDTLAQRYGGPGIMAGVLPIGMAPGGAHREAAVFWSAPVRDLQRLREAGPLALKAPLLRLWPEAGRLIDPDCALTPAAYRDVRARPWSVGRIVFLGDAAHGTSPQLGQGANLALIDGAEIGETLADAAEARDIEAALRRWRRLRSGQVRWTQIVSRTLTPVFQSRSRTAAFVRDHGLHPLSRLPVAGGVMVRTLTGRAVFPLARAWRPSWSRKEQGPP